VRPDNPVSIPAPNGARPAYSSERFVHAMGSPAHIVCGDAPDGVTDWAIAELERLEQCWSRFRPDSELSRLNARASASAAAGGWTDVSASMLLALTCAADLTRATAGRFDPTIIDALERSGYDRTFTAITADRNDVPVDAKRSTASVPGFAPVEIDEARNRVHLPAGTRIDLGGVGKGLAADLIARGLVDRGARHALVALGGDVRVRGEPIGNIGGDGWNIPVVDPFADDRILFRVPLTDGAIVTSTTRVRRWTRAGREFHHIVDPATGDPTRTGVAAVVA